MRMATLTTHSNAQDALPQRSILRFLKIRLQPSRCQYCGRLSLRRILAAWLRLAAATLESVESQPLQPSSPLAKTTHSTIDEMLNCARSGEAWQDSIDAGSSRNVSLEPGGGGPR
jgi:hypothetical protein